jgi:sugar phosphate isomerase/epimerase/predicted metal-dependent hydrolase
VPDTPEQPEARVIPLLPHLARKRLLRKPSAHRSELLLDDASADRLVRIDAAMPPIEGEQAGIQHIAALALGVSSGAFYPHLATEDTPAAAASLGFTEMEVMLQTAGEYQPAFARLMAANATAAGVRIRSVHTVEYFHQVLSPYTRCADEAREMMDKAIEFAAIVGAQVLVWHGPTRATVQAPEAWERFVDATKAIAMRCADAGITLALENVSRCALAQVRDVAAFARALGDFPIESLGFVFDPFQAAEAGANPFMMLAAMGNRVVNVHISDWLEADPSQRHLPPGDGNLPWPALTRAVAGSGYDGPLIIESSLGTNDTVATRVRQTMEPLVRAVFPFPPRGSKPDSQLPVPSELPPGVRKGIQLFNQRMFYEQHEVIEHEWHAERSGVRRLYQGLLQIGVGFHHVVNGNYRGALTLLNEGSDKVAAFTPIALGIDTGRLVRETQDCIEQLTVLGEHNIRAFDSSCIPLIHFVS